MAPFLPLIICMLTNLPHEEYLLAAILFRSILKALSLKEIPYEKANTLTKIKRLRLTGNNFFNISAHGTLTQPIRFLYVHVKLAS